MKMPKPNLNPATYLLGLPMLLTLAGCATIEPTQEPEDLGTTPAAMVANPSLPGPYGTCLDKRWFTHNEGTFIEKDHLARIRYGSTNGSCSQARPGPLVMIMRAKGDARYNYVNYDVLAKHLASHGYIVASLNLELDPAGIAALNEAFMTEYMLGAWQHASAVDPTHVGLVGHSRGAAAAMLMAESFEGAADPFTVGAIVSLAGRQDAGLHPTAAQTDGLLVLQFSNDSDINAKSSAAYYDEPYGAARFDRSLKIFEGGSHSSFLGLDGDEGVELTQGYTLTFFNALLRGNSTGYDPYIRGNAPLHTWSGGATVHQYRDRFALQVDTFEDGTVGNNDLDAVVFRSSGIYYQDVADLSMLGTSTIHRTQALRVLAVGLNQHVTWRIPSADANTQGLGVLSMRIAQIHGIPSEDLTVQIRNGRRWSPEVRLSEFGDIGQPIEACAQSNNASGCSDHYNADVMSTIRVPLTEFGASNNIRRIRLNFRGDSTYKNFYVDDIEVSEIANIN